jgi:hypothetical protein
MLILKILDHDLHRARQGSGATPLWIETPSKPEFLPSLVSSSRGKFLTVRKLTTDSRIRTGVFKYDSDRLDDLIGPMVDAALNLSVGESWGNVFPRPKAAFDYVQKSSGTTTQPHACLIPTAWNDQKVERWFGKGALKIVGGIHVYQQNCRVYRCNTETPTFFSRPDFVGLFTQIVGGMSSVLLHNVRHGMAFCRHGVSRKTS